MIKSRRLRLAGHVARMEEGRSTFKILTGTSAGKRPLSFFRNICVQDFKTDKPTAKRLSGWPRRGSEDSIRMYLKEIGINTRSWVDSHRTKIIGEQY